MGSVSYKRLLDDHERITQSVNALLDLVSETCPNIDGLLSLRAKLSTELREHWSNEDQLYHIWNSSPKAADSSKILRSFLDDYAPARSSWDDYLYEWDAESITADWDFFCNETRGVATRFLQKMAVENADIYPLAVKLGLIALRD